jgi:hypothetical protein
MLITSLYSLESGGFLFVFHNTVVGPSWSFVAFSRGEVPMAHVPKRVTSRVEFVGCPSNRSDSDDYEAVPPEVRWGAGGGWGRGQKIERCEIRDVHKNVGMS